MPPSPFIYEQAHELRPDGAFIAVNISADVAQWGQVINGKIGLQHGFRAASGYEDARAKYFRLECRTNRQHIPYLFAAVTDYGQNDEYQDRYSDSLVHDGQE